MNISAYGSLPASACTLGTQGTDGPDRIGKIVYNAAGEVTDQRVAVGTADAATEITLTYTSNGRLATLKDAENNLTTYHYDGFDRLASMDFPSPTKGAGVSNGFDFEQFGYDAASNVTSFRNRANETTSFTYDNLNRVTFKNLPGTIEPDVTYAYDNLNRLTSASVPGYTLTFGYDALSRQTFDGQGWGSISRTFDLAGRVTRTTWWDGFYVDYQRHVTGELIAVRENGAFTGPGVLASYFYDDLRRRTSLWRGNGAVTYWAYDPVSRLASITDDLAGTVNDLTQTFTYNPAHQIKQVERTNDAYAWTGHGSGSTASTANGLNQLAAIGGNATAHDARGNLTIDPTRGQTYAYTSENELKSASGGISAYYDPLGRLTEYDTNVSRRFMSDGPQIAVEIDNPNSNVVRRFVWGDALDELIVEYTGSGTSNRRWAHADERGSIIAYTDGSGTATINRYDEFGRPLAGNIGVFQYTGQMWLSELGLYNYKARNYAPHFGRFMQTDPMGYEAGPNLYAYVGNDPVNFTDPLGLDVLVIGDNTLLHLQDAFAESLLESRPRGLPFDPRSREPGTREPKEPEEVVVVCDRACQNRIQNKYRPTGRTPFYFNGTRYALDPFYEKPWWSEEFDVAVGCLAVCPIGVAVLGTEAVVVDAASVGYRLYGRGTKWQVMTRGGGVKIRSDVMKPNTHWNIEIGPWNWHIPH